MVRVTTLFGFATVVAAARPLQQIPISAPSLDEALISSSQPLVDSDSLQSHIKSSNLLKRAKELFEIAQLGVKEYNHPTRVIGSEGTSELLVF